MLLDISRSIMRTRPRHVSSEIVVEATMAFILGLAWATEGGKGQKYDLFINVATIKKRARKKELLFAGGSIR
jgi:hypothetical protein